MTFKYQYYPISSNDKLIDRLIIKLGTSAGICSVCGNGTVFFRFTQNLRETGICIFCRSMNRQRQIAVIVLNALTALTGTKFFSIQHFASQAEHGKLIIYNTETINSLHRTLINYKGYIASEYISDRAISGKIINQVMHQDLQATSFASDSIDLMISSDVFEHIPDPYQAFAEVYRILKPGGRHIFTVPFYQESYRDEVRAILKPDGTLEHLLPPIYHADPLRPEGIIVYVIFSIEMLLKLNDMGYQVKMHKTYDFLRGILGANAIVFECIK